MVDIVVGRSREEVAIRRRARIEARERGDRYLIACRAIRGGIYKKATRLVRNSSIPAHSPDFVQGQKRQAKQERHAKLKRRGFVS